MIILINSINPPLPAVTVYGGKKIIFGTKLGAAPKAGGFILKELKILEKRGILKTEDIKKLAVLSGTGSFSGIRTGMAVGNALALSLKIPIVLLDVKEIGDLESAAKIIAKKPGKPMAAPVYDREPNITVSKRKSCPVEQP